MPPPPPPSSDPFDDDIFSDPAALRAIAAIEEQALASTQKKNGVPKPLPAAARPKAAPPERKFPPRVNTNPGVRGCGFGWEPGGKHAVRMQAGQPVRQPGAQDEEATPRDVVINSKGQYGLGSQASTDDDPIVDSRARPEIRQLVDAGAGPKSADSMPAAGSQARREAILSAMDPAAAGPSKLKFAPRTLARSVSIGSHTLARDHVASRSRGLSPIGSQPGQVPSSQGAASRRAVFELEEERRLRQVSEAEVRTLRARLAALEEREDSPPWRAELQAAGQDAPSVAGLKEQLWAAQGEASTAKRNQETTEARLLGEITKLKAGLSAAQAQMKTKELEAQQRIESMKTQAIFSNHAAMASASKARQQSQWTASQRAMGQTPMKPNSPLRERNLVTPAPLTRSAKCEGIGILLTSAIQAPPRFDSLNNAFNETPNVSRKRQRTAAPSPQTTPRKSQPRGVSLSPMVISPSKSPARHMLQSPSRSQQSPSKGAPLDMAPDVSMDWQPDFVSIADHTQDPRSELVHHLLFHAVPSAADLDLRRPPQPTIVRLVSRKCSTGVSGTQLSWEALCGELVRLCGDYATAYHDLCHQLMGVFQGLLECVALDHQFEESWNNMLSTVDLLRLVSSLVLRFPSLPSTNTEAASGIAEGMGVLCKYTLRFRASDDWEDFKDIDVQNAAGIELGEEYPLNSEERGKLLEQLRFDYANALAEVGEAFCLAANKCIWVADQLSVLILHLGSQPNPDIVSRAMDLFVVASCKQDHFRFLLFHMGQGNQYPGEVPVIDVVSRFMLEGHRDPSPQRSQYTINLLSALFMLSCASPDAVILMTERSILVPALIMLIHRESSRIWGIQALSTRKDNPLDILAPAVTLLHHLVFPAPAAKPQGDDVTFSAPPQGVDLGRRLQEAGGVKEFNGVQHIFVSTFGALACAEADTDDAAWTCVSREPNAVQSRVDPRTVQFLAQDLLDAVVEGPEGDSVYEIYVGEEPDEVLEEEDYGEELRLIGAEEWDES